MRAAVDMLSRLSGPRIFVAGDMAETGGENVESYHREIGQYAVSTAWTGSSPWVRQ